MKFLLINTNQIVQKLVEITAKKSGANLTSVSEISQVGDLGQFDYIMIDDDCLEQDKENTLELLKECRKCLIHNKQSERISGFNDYIQKPFLPTAVLDILTNELGRVPSVNTQEDSTPNIDEMMKLEDTSLGGLEELDALSKAPSEAGDEIGEESGGVSLENLNEGLDEINSLLEDEHLDSSLESGLDSKNSESELETGTDDSTIDTNITLADDDDGLDVELDLSNLDELEGFGDGTGLGDEADAMAEVVAKVGEADTDSKADSEHMDLDTGLDEVSALDTDIDAMLELDSTTDSPDNALDLESTQEDSVKITESELEELDGLSDELNSLNDEISSVEEVETQDKAEAELEPKNELDSQMSEDSTGSMLEADLSDLNELDEGLVERDETENALLAKELDSELSSDELDSDLEGAESMDMLMAEALNEPSEASEETLSEIEAQSQAEKPKPLLDEEQVSEITSALQSLEDISSENEVSKEGELSLDELDSEMGDLGDLGEGLSEEANEEADNELDEGLSEEPSEGLDEVSLDEELDNEAALDEVDTTEASATEAMTETAQAAFDEEISESSSMDLEPTPSEIEATQEAVSTTPDSEILGEAEDFNALKEPEIAQALGEEIEGLETSEELSPDTAMAEDQASLESQDTLEEQTSLESTPIANSQATSQDSEIIKNMIASSVQSSISSLSSSNLKSMLDGLEVTINISFKDKNK